MSTQNPNKKKMSDIARIAGVSESTVSRALKNNPLINEATRKKIQAIAREHNYIVDKRAQNLRLQSSQTIAVVLPIDHEPGQHVSDPFFLEMIGAIADSVTEANYDLLLSRVHRNDWRQRIESQTHVDGMIIVGQSDLHEQLNELSTTSNTPFVVWGAALEDQRYTSVGSDNLLGGRLAAKHLIDNGKRSLLFIGDPDLPEIALRFEGFKQAIAEHETELEFELFVAGFTQTSGLAAMEKALSSNFEFDGVFAASDVLAICAIKSLLQKSQKIPEEVAVIGYDDIAIASQMHPALTTIGQGIYEGGQMLVSTLFALIANEKASNVLLPPKLIVRETSEHNPRT